MSLLTHCEAVRTVFVELFCTPKSSMENPSLRVSGHGSSTNRTFIVENYAEHEFGRWATDDVTGEQGYVDDERSFFWTWDDNEYTWQSTPFKSRKVKRRKGKGKGKGKGRLKRIGNAYLGEKQTQDNDWWTEEDGVWWSKGKKGRECLSKGKSKFPDFDSRTEFQSNKGTSKEQSR